MAPVADSAGLITAKDAWTDSATSTAAAGLPAHSQVRDERTMAYLTEVNNNIGTYYWIAIVILLLVVSSIHYLNLVRGLRRRNHAAMVAQVTNLPLQSRHVVPGTQRRRWACLIDAGSAAWRKYSTRRLEFLKPIHLRDLSHVTVILLLVGLNLLLTFYGTLGDPNWIAHHAARLTFANVPLIIGLAGKNNVLTWATGIPYEEWNTIHRWAARYVLVSGAIHIAGRIYTNVPNVSVSLPGHGFIAWGWLAYFLFFVMIVLASRPFRNRFYQVFLASHVFIWFLLVAALVIHRPQAQGWVWVGFILHGLDSIARGAKLVYYHGFCRVAKRTADLDDTCSGWVTKVSEDTVRVSVRTRQFWSPGQHAYLHCPEQSLGGHPFTISNIPQSLTDISEERPEQATQEFIIRVRGGLTKKLLEKAERGNLAKPTKQTDEKVAKAAPVSISVPIKAWTEGPYGAERHLGDDYNTLVLIAGGSGISFILAHALDIIRRARIMSLGKHTAVQSVATRRLTLVWITKSVSQLSWIEDWLQQIGEAAPRGLVRFEVYVTGKEDQDKMRLFADALLPGLVTPRPRYYMPKNVKLAAEPFISLHAGRPDFTTLIRDEVEATAYSDWISVGACGPVPMNESIVAAVRGEIRPDAVWRGESRRNIGLNVEWVYGYLLSMQVLTPGLHRQFGW